ncbi:unnamed protein product [Cylicocyclus nassatus]|uniref:Uncharacterized protein n=1 Tax=Cylicocyclus nassatus TaxID=53992 RepID=A0AA36M8C5_CYLNA|nr:unnamed protein product [Cylicocyclus nassatus]
MPTTVKQEPNAHRAKVCCSLQHPVIDSCEYSSLCNTDHCECHLTIGSELNCDLDEPENLPNFTWRDHHQHHERLTCTKLNLPNKDHPYIIIIQNWNETLTPALIMGLVEVNVTELRIYEIDQTTPLVDLAKYTPHLKSLEISTRTRHPIDVFDTFRHLKVLENLRLVNIDVVFARTASPWVRTIAHIHIENSSLKELPIWLAMSDKLTTLTIRNTHLHSFSTISQLRGLRSAKLARNSITDLSKHVLLSKDIYDIDLSHNKISSLAAHTFALCTELRVLDLSHNPFKHLPYKPFHRNTKLKWLKLSGTKITKLNPEHFAGLGTVKSLTLSHTPLDSIDPFAFLPLKSLKTLDLEATNITSVPIAVTQNCGLTHLNVANNMLHHRSSLPPEVIALLSGLSQIKIDGNPLMEFPPSLFLLSTDNFRLIRQLFQTTTSLPLWTEEPCTPYYWAMHLRNRSSSFRHLVSPWNDERMEREGFSYCREQYEWMLEEMEIYRDLEKNNGCAANRRLRSATLARKSLILCETNSTNTTVKKPGKLAVVETRADLSTLLLASLIANIFFLCLMLSFVCIVLCYGNKEQY